ncbi:hypothetical protein [Streptomyces sp. NPDC056165]|uniref:hypothetical protein n=1 Tax=Streptomyces sp. NPDC056165 TaxID=3345733 RepID=UPI0035DEB3E0
MEDCLHTAVRRQLGTVALKGEFLFQRHLHRHDDVDLVMSALGDDPQCLPVLISLGAALRRDVASALREVIATGAWQSDFRVRSAAVNWSEEPRFQVFLDQGLEKSAAIAAPNMSTWAPLC